MLKVRIIDAITTRIVRHIKSGYATAGTIRDLCRHRCRLKCGDFNGQIHPLNITFHEVQRFTDETQLLYGISQACVESVVYSGKCRLHPSLKASLVSAVCHCNFERMHCIVMLPLVYTRQKALID